MMALVRRIRPPYTTDEPITSRDSSANFTTDPNPPIGTAIDDAATRDESETATDDDVEVPVTQNAASEAQPSRATWRVSTPTIWSQKLSDRTFEPSGNGKATENLAATSDEKNAEGVDTVPHHAATVPPLFSDLEISNLRTTWNNVQAHFVDTPRHSVEEADKLVAMVIQRFASRFATEREALEHRWNRGEQVSTEDLRVALKHYRAFFGKLLNAA